MKNFKTFEDFINEARVNEARVKAEDFYSMFLETMHNIEYIYDEEEELSTENLLYLLNDGAWSAIAKLNGLPQETWGNMLRAKIKFKFEHDAEFMGNKNVLFKKGQKFAKAAYKTTGGTLEGMVECFMHVYREQKLVSPAIIKEMEEFLLINHGNKPFFA